MVEKTNLGFLRAGGLRPINPRRCETCEHWEPPENPNSETGSCVHELPGCVMTATPAGQMAALTYFPQMKPLQRCRHWERKTPIEN